jgi:YfiR/HmsC-like
VHRLLASLIVTGLALIQGQLAAAPVSPDPEDAVKAAVVFSLMNFTEWPEGARQGPLILGVYGRPSFASLMTQTVKGKTVNGRPLQVVEIESTDAIPPCHAVVFAGGNRKEMEHVLAAMRKAQILTIGETDQFLDLGGAVNLFLADDRISFEVSLNALEQSGLAISSKLLRFGQVRGKARGPAR